MRYYPMSPGVVDVCTVSANSRMSLAREILSHVSGRDECLYSQCEQQDGVWLVRYYPMSPGVRLTALHRSSLAVP